MVTKLKRWIRKVKSWIFFGGIISSIIAFIMTCYQNQFWSSNFSAQREYEKSGQFKEDMETYLGYAIDYYKSPTKSKDLRKILDDSPNFIYYIQDQSYGSAYTNLRDMPNNYISMDIVYSISDRYKHESYINEIKAKSAYLVEYYDRVITPRHHNFLVSKLSPKNLILYAGLKSPLKEGDIFYSHYMKYKQQQSIWVTILEVIVKVICLGGVLLGSYLLYCQLEKLKKVEYLRKYPISIFIISSMIIYGGFKYVSANQFISRILLIGLILNLIILGAAFTGCIREKVFIREGGLIRCSLAYLLEPRRCKGGVMFLVIMYIAINAAIIIGFMNTQVLLWKILYLICFGIGIILVLMLINAMISSMQHVIEVATCMGDGEITKKVEVDRYGFVFKRLGRALNHTSLGLEEAVNKAIKSEMMKTELITNVSHDLKTPLTSIINYVGLLKKQPMPNKEAEEYLQVLDERTRRLKVLIEDLVEASKATTGNLAVELTSIRLSQLMDQAIGEYKDRLMKVPIEVRFHRPEEEIRILADGKHLSRVLDNLFGNTIKYAMPHSRLYIELYKEENIAVVIMKNMSKNMLDIASEDLTQRFVRGDKARSTEGSGLGLAIAKSLINLQQGELKVETDGDLFKVILKLPLEI